MDNDRITRRLVEAALTKQAAVALIGPRQVGKSHLAREIAAQHSGALYLDLQTRQDRDKLSEPVLFLREYQRKLVVLDEIHRVPGLFQHLRLLLDQASRTVPVTGRFLILCSASMRLMRQSGESLAGRIAYVNMGPLNILNVPVDEASALRLWVRGGFPPSFRADSDAASLRWRTEFIRTYLERDVPQLGPRVSTDTLERLWTMLAHGQGALLNTARLASSLQVSGPTVTRYIDLLVDLLLVRRLPPLQKASSKRLVKAPKVYVRDSGLVHALLGLATYNDLAGHPVAGPSWEGFVMENLLAASPEGTVASFYRTAAGAEIDLLLDIPRHGLWAVEIIRSLSGRPQRGFYLACQDLRPARCYIVNSGTKEYPLDHVITAIGLAGLAKILTLLG